MGAEVVRSDRMLDAMDSQGNVLGAFTLEFRFGAGGGKQFKTSSSYGSPNKLSMDRTSRAPQV